MEKSLKDGGGWASSDPLNPPLLLQAQTLRHLSFRMTLHLSAPLLSSPRMQDPGSGKVRALLQGHLMQKIFRLSLREQLYLMTCTG